MSYILDDWDVSEQSTANTAKASTKAAVTGKANFVEGFEVSVDPTAATTNAVAVTLVLDGTTIYTGAIPASSAVGFRLGIVYSTPRRTDGAAVLNVGADGGTAIFNVNMWGSQAP